MKRHTAYFLKCYKYNRESHQQYLLPNEFHLIKTMFKQHDYDRIEIIKHDLTENEYKSLFW